MADAAFLFTAGWPFLEKSAKHFGNVTVNSKNLRENYPLGVCGTPASLVFDSKR